MSKYEPTKISDITRYAELGTLITFLHNEKLIECDIDCICNDTDKVLIQFAPLLAEEMSFDLMGGVVSIGLYYHQRSLGTSKKFTSELSKIVNILYNNATRENGKIMWKSIVDFGEKTIGYNFGIAHGIPGILLFLRKMFEIRICPNKCKELIKGGIAFLESQMHFSDIYTSIFFDICDLKYNGGNSRLSWCYGDLGIAYAFILFSLTEGLECEKLNKTALRILKYTTNRRNLKHTGVKDAGLCHGCIGIAHMYNRLYQITQKDFLLKSATYWYNEGILMSQNSQSDYEGF